ncbi:hypothetical protein Tco_0986273 [Tanacetum coccineum]
MKTIRRHGEARWKVARQPFGGVPYARAGVQSKTVKAPEWALRKLKPKKDPHTNAVGGVEAETLIELLRRPRSGNNANSQDLSDN